MLFDIHGYICFNSIPEAVLCGWEKKKTVPVLHCAEQPGFCPFVLKQSFVTQLAATESLKIDSIRAWAGRCV